ncbi:DUF4192 family protein [Microbacterium dauci]|uniref:DUF4192 family protein n=1 Tax=Microbacterium dauci TaxID=3048008 RepID=A0ABT6ZDP7_9MICO|nr:DUF4192 family protein [Microbacterium sp. LX3-4]MDJ1113850.1 DUF4192 family protein [Microbacterium sp. LX3-4]
MSMIVRAADAAHLLSLVPHLLGYTPTQSLVVIPMARGRSLGAMRVDLPPDDVDLDPVASSVMGMVCRIPQADAVVVVVYTVASTRQGLPEADLVEALRRSADACGLAVTDALTVAGDGWGSHLSADGVRPMSELDERMPPGDQATGADLPAASPALVAGVAAATASVEAALTVLCGIPSVGDSAARIDPAALEAACALDDLPALFEDALGWDAAALDPMHAAVLLWCLMRPSLRDVALVQWSSDRAGGDRALDAQRRWEDGEDYPADLAEVMWGEGSRPDPARLEQALMLVRHVAAVADRAQTPGPLATAAWLSWALGRSTHAGRLADAALDVDSRHGLADIVRSFVAASHLPDWAFRR